MFCRLKLGTVIRIVFVFSIIYVKIYNMLEFVYERSEDGLAAPVAEQAGQIASAPFAALDIRVNHRVFDAGEESSLDSAGREDGTVDLRSFIVCQAIQRNRLGIPSDTRTVSTIYQPAVVAEDQSVTLIRPYGYSISALHEATLSTHNLRMDLLDNPEFNSLASFFFAYTLAHEAGHLFDLVAPDAERHLMGNHCCNDCVMQSTSIHGTARFLDRHNGSIVFCDPCTEGISNQIN